MDQVDHFLTAVKMEKVFVMHTRGIPLRVWGKFNQRREAEGVRLGRPITREQVMLDLVRQYAEGITWFARADIQKES